METLIGLNSAVLVVATLCIFAVAYRFYGLFIASRVLKVDPARRFNDSTIIAGYPGSC